MRTWEVTSDTYSQDDTLITVFGTRPGSLPRRTRALSLGKSEASSSHCHREGERSCECSHPLFRSSNQSRGGLLATHPSSQHWAKVPPPLLFEESRGSKPKATVGTWMLPIHYIAPPCQALDLGENVASERLPAAAQPASLATGLGRWFAYGRLACPDNFCCLEDLSSLGQAQLIFSEFPVNKGKDMAYAMPSLVWMAP